MREAPTAAAARASTRAELCFTIHNDVGELTRANSLATELLERCGAGQRAIYAVQLALEEVLSNVIRYAYEAGSRHEIAVALRARDGGLELEVVDDGAEFDLTTAPAPELDVPLAQRRVGGLGIHLLRSFASEVRYERSGAKNRLRVRI